MKMSYTINGTEITIDGSPAEIIQMMSAITPGITTNPTPPTVRTASSNPSTGTIVVTNTIKPAPVKKPAPMKKAASTKKRVVQSNETTNDFVEHLYRYAPDSNHPLSKGAVVAQFLIWNMNNELSTSTIAQNTSATQKLIRKVITRMISAGAILTTNVRNVNGQTTTFVTLNSIPAGPYAKNRKGVTPYDKNGKPAVPTTSRINTFAPARQIPAQLAKISLNQN